MAIGMETLQPFVETQIKVLSLKPRAVTGKPFVICKCLIYLLGMANSFTNQSCDPGKT